MVTTKQSSHHGIEKIFVITIDGPAGAGKSTVAKKLAGVLGISYLDTGAMYRALTYKALQTGVNLEDEEHLHKLAQATMIDLEEGSQGMNVLLDGRDVSRQIRSIDVTNHTFYIAQAARIREIMVNWQRAIGEKKSIVIEGRDAGTVIFPQADWKFYLDASLEERTRRRREELKTQGKKVDEAVLREEIWQRDQKDFTRAVGPLKRAADAVLIDSTRLSIDEVIKTMMEFIQQA